MADVFISYAREDVAFVERLAALIESLGMTVWWDRKIDAGASWDIKIEEELDAAKAVVVVWSRSSVKSSAVRAEALEAQTQAKLAPIRIDDARPPLFSRGIQFEDLSNWDGDTTAIEFQDLWAQLIALTGGVAAASLVPRDGVTKVAVVATDDDAPIINMPLLHRPIGPFRSAATLIWSVAGVAFLVVMGLYREEFFGPYWEGVFVLAGAAFALFLAAERELQPNVKAMVARWLQPQPDAKRLRSSVAFLALFEAVYSKRHLSRRCVLASTLTSIVLYVALLLLVVPVDALRPLIVDLITNGPRPPEATRTVDVDYVGSTFLEANAALLFLAVPIANVFVDYFSLWQTRAILRWAANGAWTSIAVALDFILTTVIFVALLPLGPVAFVLLLSLFDGGVAAAGAALAEGGAARQTADEIWRSLWLAITVGWPGEALSALTGEANAPNTALFVAFVTTFATSAWLWFALIFAPVVRAACWTRRSGLSLIGDVVNIRKRPIASLGYAAAGLILVFGAASAGVMDAVSTPRPPATIPPGFVFKDCDRCPEMVALPGGRYLMGSPEDEPGRRPPTPQEDALEGPQTTIDIAPFAIGRFEITFREWDACVAATRERPEEERCRAIPNGRGVFEYEHRGQIEKLAFGDRGWGRGVRPVVTVSREDAEIYVAWLNREVGQEGVAYRLPSEAEWEYAARGATTTPYAFGADPERSCRFANGGDAEAARANPQWAEFYLDCSDGYAFTAPVGSYRPNAFGLYDMHGNVGEWVQDCLHNSYVGRPTSNEAWTADCPDERRAIFRGGSWGSAPQNLRAANRVPDWRFNRLDTVGFRVARAIAPSSP